jgi:hypothetical protein
LGPTTGIGQVADGVLDALVVTTALNVIRVGLGASIGEPPGIAAHIRSGTDAQAHGEVI